MSGVPIVPVASTGATCTVRHGVVPRSSSGSRVGIDGHFFAELGQAGHGSLPLVKRGGHGVGPPAAVEGLDDLVGQNLLRADALQLFLHVEQRAVVRRPPLEGGVRQRRQHVKVGRFVVTAEFHDERRRVAFPNPHPETAARGGGHGSQFFDEREGVVGEDLMKVFAAGRVGSFQSREDRLRLEIKAGGIERVCGKPGLGNPQRDLRSLQRAAGKVAREDLPEVRQVAVLFVGRVGHVGEASGLGVTRETHLDQPVKAAQTGRLGFPCPGSVTPTASTFVALAGTGPARRIDRPQWRNNQPGEQDNKQQTPGNRFHRWLLRMRRAQRCR